MGTCVGLCTLPNNSNEDSQHISIDAAQSAQIKQQLQKQNSTSNEDLPLQQKTTCALPTQKTFKKSRFYLQKHNLEGSGQRKCCEQKLQDSTIIYSKAIITRKNNKRRKRAKTVDNDWIDESTMDKTKKTYKNNRSINNQNIISNHKQTAFLIIKQKKPLLLSKVLKNTLDAQIIASTRHKMTPLLINHQVQYEEGGIYKGQWMDQARQGKGIFVWSDGSQYEGLWLNNNIQGKGKVRYIDGDCYSGEFKRNQAQGQGQFIYKSGSVYKGSWKYGLEQGQGLMVFENGDRYNGTWKAGKKHGYGELWFKDGSYYKGQFKDNQLQGQGQYNWQGKKRYKGQFTHSQMQGKGFMQWINGDKYQGYFFHDKMHGKGYFYDKNGSVFSGMWQNGRKNGIFTETKPNGQIIREQWELNKLIRQMEANFIAIDEQQITLSNTLATV